MSQASPRSHLSPPRGASQLCLLRSQDPPSRGTVWGVVGEGRKVGAGEATRNVGSDVHVWEMAGAPTLPSGRPVCKSAHENWTFPSQDGTPVPGRVCVAFPAPAGGGRRRAGSARRERPRQVRGTDALDRLLYGVGLVISLRV